ncbi:SAM-dependent methyltransferase [Brevibacillus reuszeri]|uniref:Methyltransferase type 11 n=1 Tax=Brevibacillus reuszeri TaxID=54915 RepID=A0A0K9YKX1_9BACL|nr:class I SAM-dependent methyltransferase [Brevibacillus reuszeri]KNB69317.1 methyltransferase type 11 [Brevibacillus reuszeri]MED1860386.1 class I SAM-dependent methyltransferase [Brevibacillus reuszeri]GED70727.1 SAM-dependent methyltransferase [Brevibacillus reuszeri]
MDKEKLISKFDHQSKIYEMRRKKQSEKKWREKLIGSAKGKVLEVAVGAGANFYFYPKNVDVTAVDFSGAMLSKAKESATASNVRATFIQSDIESISFPENAFDTIVSTFSFCGYEHPVRLLESFNRWCKPDGQILLMEHGLSSNRLIGSTQKIIKPVFLRVVGCHLDRNMINIFQHSPIHIHHMERYKFNTVHLVWASPNKGLLRVNTKNALR